MEDQQQPESSTTTSGPNPDHNLAFWAHLAGGIALLVCILSFIAWVPALIIYMSNKDRSRFVAFHAYQALILHGAAALVNLILFVPGMIGLFIITTPLALVLNIGAFVYSLMTALKAKNGEWAEYAVIGEYARKAHGPQG